MAAPRDQSETETAHDATTTTAAEEDAARAAAAADADVEGRPWKVALTRRGTIRSWRSRYPGVVGVWDSRWMGGRKAARE